MGKSFVIGFVKFYSGILLPVRKSNSFFWQTGEIASSIQYDDQVILHFELDLN